MAVTFPLPQTMSAPMGAKMRPMRNKVGSTAFGVRMGCQALSLCCLKAVSSNECQQQRNGSVFRQTPTSWPLGKLDLLLLRRLRSLVVTPILGLAVEQCHVIDVLVLVESVVDTLWRV